MNQSTWNRPAALFFLRFLLGLVVGLQGFGKLFNYGIWNVYDGAFKSFEAIFPAWVLVGVLFFTTFGELIAGFCLVLGIFRGWALALVAVILLVVSLGHGLESPIWDLQHVMPRAILTATLLLLPIDWDTWTLPRLLKKRNGLT